VKPKVACVWLICPICKCRYANGVYGWMPGATCGDWSGISKATRTSSGLSTQPCKGKLRLDIASQKR
jgi:hypothetical protein